MSKFINPPEKLLGHIDRISEIRAGGQPAPVNVEIDLTNRCNLGCLGCHFAHTHSRGPLAKSAKPAGMQAVGDVMEYNLATIILEEIAYIGVRSITWTGGGEPTLHPDFARLIRYAQYQRLPQGIYTNGTNIDEYLAGVMKECMTWVYVSLDRADPKSYQAYKQVDRFAQAERGIRNLIEADGLATIGVGFLVSESNVEQIPNMYKYGKDIGADYVQFRPEVSFDLANPQAGPKNADWIYEALDWFKVLAGNGVELDTSRFEMYRDWKTHPYPMCYWTQMQTVITPNGKVWACVNRRGFEGDELGDMTTDSFEDIWTRSKAHQVDHNCRVMCRGHIPNLSLDRMMRNPTQHDLFI
jgi:MoaA/NifB/PqqE/SkfB family radical SAM enzyme